MSARPLIVAIDGPVGVGKSSVARALARRLRLPHLETGAMYRALGLKVLQAGIDPEDRAAVEGLAAAAEVALERRGDEIAVLLDGRSPGARLRDPDVSEVTSRIATYPAVRRRLVELQRACAGRHGAVLEGRDIGSHVFPDAPFKFYLDAAPEVRLERRLRQLRAAGSEAPREEVAADLERRDRRDSGRAESPLTRDAGYIELDTGALSEEDVVERLAAEIRERW